MRTTSNFSVHVLFERGGDGRYRATSSDLAGLHMTGAAWEALQADLEPLLKDLLRQNSKFDVHRIQWVPSLSTIAIRVANEGSAIAQAAVKGSHSVSRLRLEIAVRSAWISGREFAASLLRPGRQTKR